MEINLIMNNKTFTLLEENTWKDLFDFREAKTS